MNSDNGPGISDSDFFNIGDTVYHKTNLIFGKITSIPNNGILWVKVNNDPEGKERGWRKNDVLQCNKADGVKDPVSAMYPSTALRSNEGKIEFSLIPCKAQEEEAKVWMFGKKKYGRNNWTKGGEKLSYMSIIDSMERHINDFKKGITYDVETGIHQAAHIRCNAAMLIEFDGTDKVPDDRRD